MFYTQWNIFRLGHGVNLALTFFIYIGCQAADLKSGGRQVRISESSDQRITDSSQAGSPTPSGGISTTPNSDLAPETDDNRAEISQVITGTPVEFAPGQPSQIVTGINLTFDNARLKCVDENSTTPTRVCQLLAQGPTLDVPTAIAPGLQWTWEPIGISQCLPAGPGQRLTFSCPTPTVIDGITEIAVKLEDTGTGRTRYERHFLSGRSFGLSTPNTLGTNLAESLSLVSLDFEGDGDSDLISVASVNNSILLFRNNVTSWQQETISASVTGARDVRVGDWDRDGNVDFIVGSITTGQVQLIRQSSPGVFAPPALLAGGMSDVRSVRPADFDGDGRLDLLVGAIPGPVAVALYWQDPSGSVQQQILSSSGTVQCVQPVDLDKDGDLDIIAGASASGQVQWFENLGNRNFVAHDIATTEKGVYYIEASDLDKDGAIDILSAAIDVNRVVWFRQTAPGVFTPQTLSVELDGPIALEVTDWDMDGDLDIFAVGYRSDNLAIIINDKQTFSTQILAGQLDHIHSVRSGDFNGDGVKDVAVTAFRGNLVNVYQGIRSTSLP